MDALLTLLNSEDEPIIRRLLHYYTSWSSIEDEEGDKAAADRLFFI